MPEASLPVGRNPSEGGVGVYAIFRIKKLKSFEEILLCKKHHYREKDTPNADPSRTGQNIAIIRPEDVIRDWERLVGEQKIRKNAVLAVEILISASPEFFDSQEKTQKWVERVKEVIQKYFPTSISAVVHMDETTPHAHVLFVPLHESRLNAKHFFGGPEKLKHWQTVIAKEFEDLGLQRGLEGSKAKHVDVKQFYTLVNKLNEQDLEIAREVEKTDFLTFLLRKGELVQRIEQQESRMKAGALMCLLARRREREIRRTSEAKERVIQALREQNQSLKRENASLEEKVRVLQRRLSREKLESLRRINLVAVLEKCYGAVEKKDSKPHYRSRKFKLPDGRDIAVTRDLWIDNDTKIGGKGALDLVMYLENCGLLDAARILMENFPELGEDIAREAGKKYAELVRQEIQKPVQATELPPRTEDQEVVQKAIRYLTEERKIPLALVQDLMSQEKIYVDSFGNWVFRRVHGGAFVRGTRGTFKKTVGGKECGPFILEGQGRTVFLCEGPVDALSIKAMHPKASVIALGGNLIGIEEVRRYIPEGAEVFAAFDNDEAGRRLAQEAKEKLGAQYYGPPFTFKDWNDFLKAFSRFSAYGPGGDV